MPNNKKTIIEQAKNNMVIVFKYLKISKQEYSERLTKEALRLCIREIKQMAMVNANTPLQKYLYIKKKQLKDFEKQEGIE